VRTETSAGRAWFQRLKLKFDGTAIKFSFQIELAPLLHGWVQRRQGSAEDLGEARRA